MVTRITDTEPRAGWLPFALPHITEREAQAVLDVLDSGWLTTGGKAKEFERAFASYLGVSHAVALNSGTAALHLALEAIDLKPDDEVIVPTYTFTASAEVVRYFGARPVLVDVNPEDLNIDVQTAAGAVTSRTRAIIGVDIGGQPCAWDELRPIAAAHDLVLVDDAAHALPSQLHGKAIGSWADLTAFSFYATKTLTTGEGGMLVTHNEEWARRAAVMSLHGIAKDAWRRYTAEGSWYYEVVAPGFKYNLTDIAAALGLVQLQRLEEMTCRRAAIAARYDAAFAQVPELEPPVIADGRTTSWHLYIVRLCQDRLCCSRDEFIRALTAQNIGCSVHFIPLHLHPYYRETYGLQAKDFPVASREYQRVVSLPIYSRMSDADVDDVIGSVERVVEANRA